MSRERGDILELLPEVMRAADAPGTPFAALIDAMHAISAPIDRVIDDLDRWFDPATAPVDFLRLLAAWLDLDVAADVLTALEPDAERRERRLRRLVAEGHDLVRRRGTAESLRRLVELAFSIPARRKMRGWETKALWKDSVGDALPERIRGKKKQGFTFSSYHQWTKDLRGAVEGELTPAWCRDTGLFQYEFVREVLDAPPHPRCRWHYFMVWMMLGVKQWMDGFGVRI